jgi:hypothetical protein
MTMKCALFWPMREFRSRLWDKANILRIFVTRRMSYSFALALILYPSLLIQTRDAKGQNSQAEDNTLAIENSGVPVEIDGRPILVVYAGIAGITPQERAQAIQQRIITLARRKDVPLAEIRIEDRGTWSEIVAAGERIMGVTRTDAQGAERDRVELAAEYAEVIRQAVQQYRAEHTWRNILLGVSYTASATLGVGVLLLILVKNTTAAIYAQFANRCGTGIFLDRGSSFDSGVRDLGPAFLSRYKIHFISDYKLVVLRTGGRGENRNRIRSASNAGLNHLPGHFVPNQAEHIYFW